MHPRLDSLDLKIARWMHRTGHRFDRLLIGALFIWFGSLKMAGLPSATSIIAKTVYFGDPTVTVPILGAWEAAIGICLIHRPFLRAALLLLFIRLPGTLLALILKFDVCFDGAIWAPTIQGQYLIKDFVLIGTAMIIGGTVRDERERKRQ